MRTWVNDPELMYRRRWITLTVICMSLMVIGLDNTILNVAIPTLGRQLHATTSSLQWIVDIYTLVFAGLLLTCGSLGDRFGRYKTLTLGLIIFGTGSVASAMAGSTDMLIATRAFMGIGGALIMPATLSIITNVFTDARGRSKAIGIWAGVAALGIGIGPVAGGFLLSHFYWGSVFFVNIPIVIAALIGGWFFVPDSRDPTGARIDFVGALLSILGLASLLWGVIEAPVKGWGSPTITAAFVAGFLILGAFVWWELNSAEPMLDMRFFRNPRFSAASGAVSLTFFSLFGSLFLLTQYLQSVHGYSPLKAGAVVIPQAAMMMMMAPLSTVFVRRVGNKLVVGFGLVLVALSLGAFGFLSIDAAALGDPDHHPPDGCRDGQRHGARDGLDHGLTASCQGRCRVGDERHHPPDRWCHRRGCPRIDPGLEVPQQRVVGRRGRSSAGQGDIGDSHRYRLRPHRFPHADGRTLRHDHHGDRSP